MLKVTCLPSHPLKMLVARKKRRGSEAIYEALLPLPVKTNLVYRKVLTDDVCEHCKQFPEEVYHAVWLCPSISAVRDFDPM